MDPKEIAEFIQANIKGCKLVGVSSDNEIFIEFDHDDEELEVAASRRLKEEFTETSQVVSVVRPSIVQLTEMIDALNSLLGEEDSPPKGPLLDIGEF